MFFFPGYSGEAQLTLVWLFSLSFPVEFGIESNSWLVGAVNSA
jgi:hypothetical protein